MPINLRADLDLVDLGMGLRSSIKRELGWLFLPIDRFRLILLIQDIITKYQVINFGAHEAAIRIFGTADYRLAPNIEAGVHNYAITSQLLELLD